MSFVTRSAASQTVKIIMSVEARAAAAHEERMTRITEEMEK